jgi:adenine phosphoribosyltransferase
MPKQAGTLPLRQDQADWLKSKIRNVADFPKPGIMFRDLTTLLSDHDAFSLVIKSLVLKYKPLKPHYIAGIEARGFIFGATLAYELGAGFLAIRKPGKLPSLVERIDYKLEYGMDALEIRSDVFQKTTVLDKPSPPVSQCHRVILVDDLLATGGTAAAAVSLIKKLGGDVLGVGFVVELAYLNGRSKFAPDINVFSLLTYE